MDILQLKYFYKIANSRTLTQAAEDLHISQPALSGMIRKMEAELGGRLFEKEGRSLKINKRGEILLRYSEEILRNLEEMQQEIQRFNHGQENCISIELGAASQLVLPIISRFQKQYPAVQIRLLQNQIKSGVRSEEADLVFSTSTTAQSEGICLLEESLVLAVPKNHPLAERKYVEVRDFQEEGFVLLSKEKNLRKVTDRYCAQMGFTPAVNLESDDLGTVKELIQSGFGISIIPKISWGGLSEENIVRIPIITCDCRRYIYLIQKKQEPDGMLGLFIEEVKRTFSKIQREN